MYLRTSQISFPRNPGAIARLCREEAPAGCLTSISSAIWTILHDSAAFRQAFPQLLHIFLSKCGFLVYYSSIKRFWLSATLNLAAENGNYFIDKEMSFPLESVQHYQH